MSFTIKKHVKVPAQLNKTVSPVAPGPAQNGARKTKYSSHPANATVNPTIPRGKTGNKNQLSIASFETTIFGGHIFLLNFVHVLRE